MVVPADRRATFTDPGYQRQLYPAFEGGAIELVRHAFGSGTGPASTPGPAMSCATPADLPHSFENVGDGPCAWLLIVPTTPR